MKWKIPHLLVACLLLAGQSTKAQLMLGGQASYLTGDDQSLWGGGIQIKALIGKRVAIGGTIRSYPKSYSERTIGGTTPTTIRTANTITPVLGTLEYYFGKDNGIQPYIGADAGLYLHRLFTQINSGNTVLLDTNDGQTYFGVAPKFGLLFKTGGLIAPFVQAQYHANFGSGDGDDILIPGVNNPIRTEVANSFATFDAGIILRLRAAGR